MKITTNRKHHLDHRLIVIGVCLFLAAIVFATFGRSIHNDFVKGDDNDYVYEHPHIIKGLSAQSVAWAFTHVHADNWHPLTSISHMLDCQIYGLQPWGHHLTNILLHALGAMLLFLALLQLTNAGAGIGDGGRDQRSRLQVLTSNVWPCAFVAALFAIHPLRAESVAWVSERKDVLSGVFFMLTLSAYARYVQSDRHRTRNYILVLICFAIGLLCKPTLVTLPFVLLLLDYWPLARCQKTEVRGQKSVIGGQSSRASLISASQHFSVSAFQNVRGLLIEKLPLFVLSAASCVATMIAQRRVIEQSVQMNLIERANNAFVSYVAYLGEMFWPSRLSISHPYSEGYQNLPLALASLSLLLVISVLCFRLRKSHPFLLTGWLWYIGVLVPMIGVVQVSAEARADRYTYLSQIGLYIMLSWGALALTKTWHFHRAILVASASLILIAFGMRSYGQTACWRNTETLWRHATDVSPFDYIAHDSLGSALVQDGHLDEAIVEFEKAIQIKPNYAPSYNNLGNALLQNGQPNLATPQYQKALELDPRDSQVHNNLGTLLLKEGRLDEAIEQYREAVAAAPDVAELHYNLGSALIMKGNWDDAIKHLEAALNIDNDYPEAHNKLGIAFGAAGRMDEAISQFKEALRLHHIYPQAQYNLGSILVHVGQRQEGIAHLLEAVRLKPDYTEAKEELRELGVAPP